MNNFKNWNIYDKPCCIGGGGHWNVYRAFLKEEQSIGDCAFSQFIYKESKDKNNIKDNIEHNLKAYNHIKKTNLPTLAFYFQECYNGNEVIIGEDLNNGNLLFVSPNNDKHYEPKFDNNAEKQLKDNKITEILNFDDFIKQIKTDMEEISRLKIDTCEDMFFFGTYKDKKESEIFYKIADFDSFHIYNDVDIDDNMEFTNMVLRNTYTMLNALWEYAELFLDISTKEIYTNKLSNERENIKKQHGQIQKNLCRNGG